MPAPPLTYTALEANLRNLLLVRALFLLVVCATLSVCYWQLDLPLAYQSMLLIVSVLAVISLLTLVRLNRLHHCTETSFFAQLLIDIIAVTWLLYFVGGADNPFVSYYLVPLCIAAATLSWRYTWPLVMLALTLYTLLFFFRVSLPDITPQHHGTHSGASIHTLGMWFNFLVSASLISYFVVKMAAALRGQATLLTELREDKLRDEQLLAVATLAAGTAHELGTPMTTVKTLLHDMQADYREPVQLREDLNLLQNQVTHCTTILQQLSARAASMKDGVLPLRDPARHCHEVIDDWLLLRPDVEARIRIADNCPAIDIPLHPTLLQAMANLLHNAADANPAGIEVEVSWTDQWLTFRIRDRGPGIDADIIANLGDAFVSNKGEGRGLGLFLTRAAVSRHGGQVSIRNLPHGGTETTMLIPIHAAQSGRY